MAKIVTLEELETYWSIDDLADANEALDLKDEVESQLLERAKK